MLLYGSFSECIRFKELYETSTLNYVGNNRRSREGVTLICRGFILPSNYVALSRFENIFKTHNRFRAFMSQGKTADSEIISKMADVVGLSLADTEARKIARQACMGLFSVNDASQLPVDKRLILAMTLRNRYRFSLRQISVLAFVPEEELRRFF